MFVLMSQFDGWWTHEYMVRCIHYKNKSNQQLKVKIYIHFKIIIDNAEWF